MVSFDPRGSKAFGAHIVLFGLEDRDKHCTDKTRVCSRDHDSPRKKRKKMVRRKRPRNRKCNEASKMLVGVLVARNLILVVPHLDSKVAQ